MYTIYPTGQLKNLTTRYGLFSGETKRTQSNVTSRAVTFSVSEQLANIASNFAIFQGETGRSDVSGSDVFQWADV